MMSSFCFSIWYLLAACSHLATDELYVELGLELQLESCSSFSLLSAPVQIALRAGHRGLLVEGLALQPDLQVGVVGLGLLHLPL